jgi:hypothetical protein
MHGLETIRKINARDSREKPRVTYYDENDQLRTRVFDSEEEKAAFIRDTPSKDIILT